MFWKILLTLLVFGSVDAAGVFKLSLTRPSSYYEKSYEQVRLDAVRNLHLGSLKHLKTRGGRLASSTQPLYDYSTVYIANVTVGAPEQQFRVLVDTALTDFWIPDKTCTSSACICSGDGCFPKNFFDSSKSAAYRRDGRPFTEYNNRFSGFLGIEVVGLGAIGSDKLVVPSVTFGQMTRAYEDYPTFPFDGVLGLAFPKLSEDGAKPVFDEVVDQSLVDEPIFTIWLKNEIPGTKDPTGGQITWGGLDTDNCDSTVMYTPLISQDYWVFRVDYASIGTHSRSGSWSAIVDSATAMTVIPMEVQSDMIIETNATYSFNYGLYQVDCGIKFKWSASINGQMFTIDESAGVWEFAPGYCFLSFEYFETDFGFVFGGPMAKTYCTVYDITGQIGFAKAKQ